MAVKFTSRGAVPEVGSAAAVQVRVQGSTTVTVAKSLAEQAALNRYQARVRMDRPAALALKGFG